MIMIPKLRLENKLKLLPNPFQNQVNTFLHTYLLNTFLYLCKYTNKYIQDINIVSSSLEK